MITVKDLTQKLGGQTILHSLSFQVESGEVTTLVGPSGSGKTTLLRCLAKLDTPTEGEICHSNLPIGVVFQGFHLFPHMSVLQNLIYAPVLKGVLTSEIAREKAIRLLELNGLGHRIGSYPSTLSGGEKQRVAILRSLMMDPKILFFDEPTSALDPLRTQDVLKLIRSLAQTGITLFIVTHDMQLVDQVADRVLVLEEGRLVEDRLMHRTRGTLWNLDAVTSGCSQVH